MARRAALLFGWIVFFFLLYTMSDETAMSNVITVNTKTANAPPQAFKPWVTVDAFWSNQPPFPSTKPTGQGQCGFISYNAKLVTLLSIRKQDDFIVTRALSWVALEL